MGTTMARPYVQLYTYDLVSTGGKYLFQEVAAGTSQVSIGAVQ